MAFRRKDSSKSFGPPSKIRKLGSQGFMPSNNSLNSLHRELSSNLNVFVRVRPMNNEENNDKFRNVVKVVDEKLLVFDPKEEQAPFFFHGTKQKIREIGRKENKQLEFLFDGVFGPTINNMDIHLKTTHCIIESLLEGYNCSVFVYGATGAGKTHTMLGKEDIPGIMFHTMAELYHKISSISQEKECQLGVSFVEVYNENVYDLLHPAGPLFLREDSRGVSIVGLKVESIYDIDQLLQKLSDGNKNRKQHPTDSNAESSRSHAVFQVYVRMMVRGSGEVKIAKLSMIDLAGSERGMATGCKGERFKEGSNINKSLLALGNCISNLADNLKYIPYRDSKLTRLLKDSLGGNCHTVMIANISPSSASYEDTYNTLKFASRAKKITTKLKKNILSSDLSVAHFMKLVEKLESENLLLQSKLRGLEKTATDSARAVSQIPDTTVWCSHLDTIFDEKIRLCKRILKVKSEARILECRINFKILNKENLKNFKCISESMIRNIDHSINKFKQMLNSLEDCLKDVTDKLKNNSEKLKSLFVEMEEARVLQYIKKEVENKNAILRNVVQEMANKHLMRLLVLQHQRAEAFENAFKLKDPLLNDYYSLLTGSNMITRAMKSDHERAMSCIEKVKSVSWVDDGSENIEESVNNKILVASNLSFDESLFVIDVHNQTVKLEPTVLPITDVKEDEVSEEGKEQKCKISNTPQKNNDVNLVSTEENIGILDDDKLPDLNVDENCFQEDKEVEKDDGNKQDDLNSTITLDEPTVIPTLSLTVFSEISNDTQSLPSINDRTNAPSINLEKPTNLNETVTIGNGDDIPLSSGTDYKSKKRVVNSADVRAPRIGSSLSSSRNKCNTGSLLTNKENLIQIKKNYPFKKVLPDKQNNLKKGINQTAIRQALKPKPPNIPTSTLNNITMTKPVPNSYPLKVTNSKNKIKNNLRQKVAIGISKTADKRR